MPDIRYFAKEFVISFPDKGHDPAFLSLVFYADHNFPAAFPFTNQLRNHLRRILKIRVQPDHAVTVSLLKTMHRRTHLSKIPRVKNRLDMRICLTLLPKQHSRIILRMIVNIDDLVVVGGKLLRKNPRKRLRHRVYIFLLIVRRNHHRNQLFHSLTLVPKPLRNRSKNHLLRLYHKDAYEKSDFLITSPMRERKVFLVTR